MLTFCDPRHGMGRREFLRIGGLGLGGLTLPQLLASHSLAAAPKRSVRDKSVIFLFMHGGPSQIETFDPKMTAPIDIRSATGEVATSLPGITFGSTLQKLAPLADKFSIVRSFTTGDGNHDIKPVVGVDSLKANLGSIYSRVAGLNHPITGMPLNAALFPQSVDPKAGPAQEGFGKFYSTGSLSSAYAPFVPGANGDFQNDLKLTLPRERIDDRRSLLTGLDRIRRETDSSGLIDGLDKFQQQAFQTILGGVAEAFDLSKEDPQTVARYDTAGLVSEDSIDKRWNNHKHYRDHTMTLGKLLLLARRLCEAGCGFVTVTTNFVWDMHADVNNATMEEGMRYCGLAFDHAVSAFIEDTRARGLDKHILLVCTGEMGRTPRINKNGGRDHWGGLAPLLLYGGGLEMGRVIGQSTRDVGQPLTEPMTIRHLIATIMHTLFDVSELRLTRGVPNEVARVVLEGDPIPGLL